MRTKHLLLLTLTLAGATVSAQTRKKSTAAAAPASAALPRPKLVVGVMVDQMRWDYLYRFYDRYQTGGFKRMLNEGFTCENTNINYIPTVTAIGHSSVYTGSVPALHGIAGNEFINQATGKGMYCAGDSTVQTVGSTSAAGKMSPRNLTASTITDELKLATNFRSKVIGIALKDRGGILPAGHAANAAYWFDDFSGNWISSTFYMKDLPAWVKKFNDQKLPEKYLKQDWNTLYPIETYVQSTPDNSRYEGKFAGAEAAVFPVKTSELYKGRVGMIRATPYGNTLTLDLAKAAIENEQLGNNVVTDFLAVSLSSTDYVGHQFGVNAVEVEDIYLRLDRDLANFFSYLDGKVGKGNYTVFLTADHGAAHNPNFLTDHQISAGLWSAGNAQRELNKLMEDRYKVKNLVIGMDNYQVNFNNAAIKEKNLSLQAMKYECIDWLSKQPEVAFAVDMQQAQTANIPEELRTRIINGYNPERSGAIQIILKPGYYAGSSPTGTTHGTWNPYDAHIPLVFMGWGINHGSLVRPTSITDISATLAALLHIQAPNGCIGAPISEVIKK